MFTWILCNSNVQYNSVLLVMDLSNTDFLGLNQRSH